jgi:hypothetical protein
VKNVNLAPATDKLHELWSALDQLFGEHHFITILAAFFAVMMTISFYRLLRSISPALVAFVLMLIFGLLVLHWTFTRTEPALLTPAIDVIAPFFPQDPDYPQHRGKPPARAAPAHPAARS